MNKLVPGWRNGRRAGLKILFCRKGGVRVQIPPRAPLTPLISLIIHTALAQSYMTFYYYDSVKSAEGPWLNNKPEGIWKNYYPSGVMKSTGKFTGGLPDSIWTFFDDSGKVIKKITYEKGKKNGICEIYDPPGILYKAEIYMSDTIHGIVRVFYPSGKLRETIPYVKGKREGTGYEYDTSGTIITINEYLNDILKTSQKINRYNPSGQKDGTWIEFYQDMKIKIEGRYMNGKKHGFFKYYTRDGKIEKVLYYLNDSLVQDTTNSLTRLPSINYINSGETTGIIVSTVSEYGGAIASFTSTPDGKITYRKIIGNTTLEAGDMTSYGIKDGRWIEFYPDGKISAIEHYKKGVRDGYCVFFYPSGDTFQTGQYCNGLPCGEWRTYYLENKLMKIYEYNDGQLEGNYVEFSENGQIVAQGYYHESLEEGIWILNYGDFRQQCRFIKGQPDGKCIGYYADSTIMFIENYSMGKKHGIQRYYNDKKKLIRKEVYREGVPHGKWKYYLDDGSLYLTLKFRKGRLVSIDGIKIK